MTASKNIWFYLPFGLIFFTVYRNSILPGAKVLWSFDALVIFALSLIYLVYNFGFSDLANIRISSLFGNNNVILILIILFLISTVFFNSQEFLEFKNLIRFLDLILEFIMFFLIIPQLIVSSAFLLKKLILIISYFSLISSIIGFIMLFAGVHGNYDGLMITYVGHPNYVSVIFNSGVIATIFYVDWQKDMMPPFTKYFYYLSVAIQTLASLFTYTRAGYIGLCAGLLIYFFLKYKKKFLLITPFIAIFIVFIIPPFFKAKGFGSFLSRFYLLIPAYSMMTHDKISLLWGYGVSNAFKVFLKYNMLNLAGEDFINNPHNAIASLILMFGLIFTVVILSLLSFMLIRFIRMSWKSDTIIERLFYAFVVSMLVSFVFLSLFDSSVLMPEFFSLQIFLIFLGFINCIKKDSSIVKSLFQFRENDEVFV